MSRSERAAREAESETGTPAKAVLESDRRRLLSSWYPGPACLGTHEVEQAVREGLASLHAGRREHAETCPPCAALLTAATRRPWLVAGPSQRVTPARASAADTRTVQEQLSSLDEQMSMVLAEVKALRMSIQKDTSSLDDAFQDAWRPTPESSDAREREMGDTLWHGISRQRTP